MKPIAQDGLLVDEVFSTYFSKHTKLRIKTQINKKLSEWKEYYLKNDLSMDEEVSDVGKIIRSIINKDKKPDEASELSEGSKNTLRSIYI